MQEQPSQSAHPPQQIFCPNCRGGNDPEALYCRWCGGGLRGFAQAAPIPTPVKKPKKRRLLTILFLLGLFTCVILSMALMSSPATQTRRAPTTDKSAGLAVAGSPTTTSTPQPAVQGPSYAEYNGKHKTMTDAQWASYIKTLDGNVISDWQGWVYDVVRKNDSVYNLKIDQDGPDETLAVGDVVIQIPASEAEKFNKHQKVTYSGTIDHIDCAIGLCKVIVVDAVITP